MQLAALLVQPHPHATVLRKHILDLHGNDGPDAREAEEHEADKGLVAQIDVRRDADAIKQHAHFSHIENRRLPLRTTWRGPRTDKGGLVCVT
jgi:hypothetical protein